jgi:hypothetical protein
MGIFAYGITIFIDAIYKLLEIGLGIFCQWKAFSRLVKKMVKIYFVYTHPLTESLAKKGRSDRRI